MVLYESWSRCLSVICHLSFVRNQILSLITSRSFSLFWTSYGGNWTLVCWKVSNLCTLTTLGPPNCGRCWQVFKVQRAPDVWYSIPQSFCLCGTLIVPKYFLAALNIFFFNFEAPYLRNSYGFLGTPVNKYWFGSWKQSLEMIMGSKWFK